MKNCPFILHSHFIKLTAIHKSDRNYAKADQLLGKVFYVSTKLAIKHPSHVGKKISKNSWFFLVSWLSGEKITFDCIQFTEVEET